MLDLIEHGRIHEIRLARPPANALNDELATALAVALNNAGKEADAVIVSGLPGMFSAGLDVPELIGLDREQFTGYWTGFVGLLESIARMPVPTVFALTGHAPAGGIVLALFGDYRIMPSGNYKTGLNEVAVGLVAPRPAQQALIRLIGAHQAERILVSGEMMDAARAHRIGLVDELADDPEAVRQRAIEWCEQHLALPAQAMAMTRTMLRADLHALFDGDTAAEVEKFAAIWFEEETQQTLRALVSRLSGG